MGVVVVVVVVVVDTALCVRCIVIAEALIDDLRTELLSLMTTPSVEVVAEEGPAVVCENVAYVVGGQTDDGEVLSSMECYDAASNTRGLVAPMRTGRHEHAA